MVAANLMPDHATLQLNSDGNIVSEEWERGEDIGRLRVNVVVYVCMCVLPLAGGPGQQRWEHPRQSPPRTVAPQRWVSEEQVRGPLSAGSSPAVAP